MCEVKPGTVDRGTVDHFIKSATVPQNEELHFPFLSKTKVLFIVGSLKKYIIQHCCLNLILFSVFWLSVVNNFTVHSLWDVQIECRSWGSNSWRLICLSMQVLNWCRHGALSSSVSSSDDATSFRATGTYDWLKSALSLTASRSTARRERDWHIRE